MAAKKKRKLFQVAKELNLATATLAEELEQLGFKVTKAQMTPIDDDAYGQLLRKFAPERWAEEQEGKAREESARQEAESQQVREEELRRILESDRAAESRKPAPSVRKAAPEDLVDARKTPPPRPKKDEEPEAPAAEAPEEAAPRTGEKPGPSAKQAPRRRTSTPSVRGAAPPSAPEERSRPAADKRPSRDERPSREQREERPAAHGRRGAPSVRGGVSNEDIMPAPPPPPAPKPVRTAAPSPQVHDKDDEDKPSKRKRKRKGRGKAPDQQPERAKKGGGWVSTGDSGGGKRRRKRDKKKKPDAAEVEASIKQTLAAMEDRGGGRKRKKRRVESDVGMVDEETNLLKITEYVTTQDLANLMDIQVTELIKDCLMLGLRVTINQRLEKDTIQLLAEEHGYKVEFLDDMEQQEMTAEKAVKKEELEEGTPEPRAPVVTVMGHVDHGKTTLLDHIRHAHVAEGEAGGITQHIGAYEIEHGDQRITFLDTPGHEAFTAMRARGAQVTDIVVLVVAADDQVMPQTVEAIDHAKAAEVPIVVAINKMDKPGANSEKVRQQLADHGVLVEEWGGEIQASEVSAKKGTNIEDLLDKILIAAELLELKAPRDVPARGYVIESRMEKGLGTLCSVLVQRGALKVGDVFVAGPYFGRVRAMYDEKGKKRDEVGPGQPAQITGFEGAPHVGDQLVVFREEREAKEISSRRQQQLREQEMRMRETVSSPQRELLQLSESGEKRELRLVIKGDVDGSVEAISDSLMRLSTEEVEVKIIHRNVGPINESDILLASASNAMVIGFNVHPMGKSREMALRDDVPFETYRVIYELIDDVKNIIIGMHKTETAEEVTAELEVRDTFKISRIGTIAGCYVTSGKIERNHRVRVLREGTQVFDGEIDTLKRFKDDAKEVAQGYECGLKVAGFNDIKVGDVVQSYKIVEVDRQIEVG